MHKALDSILHNIGKIVVVTDVYNLSSLESVESETQGYLQPYSKFKARLGYMRSSQKQNKIPEK